MIVPSDAGRANQLYNMLVSAPDKVSPDYLPPQAQDAQGYARLDETLRYAEVNLTPLMAQVVRPPEGYDPGQRAYDMTRIARGTGSYALFWAAAQEAVFFDPYDPEPYRIATGHASQARLILGHHGLRPIWELLPAAYLARPYLLRLLLDVEHPSYRRLPDMALLDRRTEGAYDTARQNHAGLYNLVHLRKQKIVAPGQTNDPRMAPILEGQLWWHWNQRNPGVTERLEAIRAQRLLKSIQGAGRRARRTLPLDTYADARDADSALREYKLTLRTQNVAARRV